METKIVIFDLDGTLALCDHRKHLIENPYRWNPSFSCISSKCTKPTISFCACTIEEENHKNFKPNWDEFYKRCVDDTPNWPVVELYQNLNYLEYALIVLTGRSEAVKKETLDWFRKHNIPQPGAMYMREEKDYTPDHLLKSQWMDKLLEKVKPEEILFAVEDRKKVVDMWRGKGITCLQVAEGNF